MPQPAVLSESYAAPSQATADGPGIWSPGPVTVVV